MNKNTVFLLLSGPRYEDDVNESESKDKYSSKCVVGDTHVIFRVLVMFTWLQNVLYIANPL